MTFGQPVPLWQPPSLVDLPTGFTSQVELQLPQGSQHFTPLVAQILYQRGIREPGQVSPFLNPDRYTPASPFDFNDMAQACDRIIQARDRAEKVAIWGDFDADGITATAVLWEGLGNLFPAQQLTYLIPNRLTQSHGLHREGIASLAEQGYALIITCDTGSTHAAEIQLARERGIDVIVTDHHTLPAPSKDAPLPAIALINPRSLPPDHPLSSLSGVAVAYKLIEALYERLKHQRLKHQRLELPSPKALLDLVAIGLIADLVELRGDCRYLAQVGITHLQRQQRPGLKYLIQQCQRSGDRPADISYGLGPRINAVSRIYGDASFCVELLTTRDDKRAAYLAQQAELANQRRRSLQQRVLNQVESRLEGLDDTTRVIVLGDPQWSVGILGLVAAQVAQRYGRPTLLLQTPVLGRSADAATEHTDPVLARGSARSVQGLDLYALICHHTHLLQRFGGHPYALGLSLPVDNIALLRDALNREARIACLPLEPHPEADIELKVRDIGPPLFQALKRLEPFGMGHPIPKILLRDVWFSDRWSSKQTDLRGQNTYYPRTTFRICDDSSLEGRAALWWGHHKRDLPEERCDVLVELDFDSYHKDYRLRLVALTARSQLSHLELSHSELSHSELSHSEPSPLKAPALEAARLWSFHASPEANGQAERVVGTTVQPAVVDQPPLMTPEALWQQLVGIAKYLSRTGEGVTARDLLCRLGVSEPVLTSGLKALQCIGFEVTQSPVKSSPDSAAPPIDHTAGQRPTYWFTLTPKKAPPSSQQAALHTFLELAHEEQFRYRYGLAQAAALEHAAHG